MAHLVRLFVLALLLSAVSEPSLAGSDLVRLPRNAAKYSSVEIQNAKPHQNPLSAPNADNARAEGSNGLTPGGKPSSGDLVNDFSPQAFGSFGIPYTSKRVSHRGISGLQVVGPNALSVTFPYRAVGKLFFKDYGGLLGYCTASVIRRSVLLTAAHCIQKFGDPRFYTDFVFVPATYSAAGSTNAQKFPFGQWNFEALARAATWADGTDVGVGYARNNDIAVLILTKDTKNRFLGDIVGKLGYGWNNPSFVSSPKTGNLLTGLVSTLGYPALLDSGRIMQRSDSPAYLTTVGVLSRALQLWQGSNFAKGSSGGPWVVNFGAENPVYSGGAGPGRESAQMVVGVTSWGHDSTNTAKGMYSSRFGPNSRYPLGDYGGWGAGNIGSLMNTLCSLTKLGTTQTYAALGYCG